MSRIGWGVMRRDAIFTNRKKNKVHAVLEMAGSRAEPE